MSKPQITNEEAVRAMLDFVNRNLRLRDIGIEKTGSSVIFSGRGLQGTENEDVNFALEVVTALNRSIRIDVMERRYEKDKESNVKGVYLFPRSIMYPSARTYFKSPYLRPARDKLGLDNMHTHFQTLLEEVTYNNAVALSNAEEYVTDVLSGRKASSAVYYNPLHDELQVARFIRFPSDVDIPAHVLWIKRMAYRTMETHPYVTPGEDDTYAKIQRKLHHEVRKMSLKPKIRGNEKFTLAKHGKGSTVISTSDLSLYQSRPSVEKPLDNLFMIVGLPMPRAQRYI